jgi:large subunit ribosomal protein L35
MKLKTNSGAAKRMRFTKKGKIKRSRARRRHLLTVGKTESRKRHLRKAAYVESSEAHRMRRLMPYG